VRLDPTRYADAGQPCMLTHRIMPFNELIPYRGSLSARGLLPTLLRLGQPLRHLLVLRRVICPTPGGCAPPIIDHRHVDAAVDEELHGFVILVPDELMKNAGGLLNRSRWDLFPCRGPVVPCRTLPPVSAACNGTVKSWSVRPVRRVRRGYRYPRVANSKCGLVGAQEGKAAALLRRAGRRFFN